MGYSVLEVLNTFIKISGVNLKYEIGGRRAGDVVQIFADTTYANNTLGWKAKENLESMIKSAWAWEQNIQNCTLIKYRGSNQYTNSDFLSLP